MSKDPRLSIRITAELEAWLESEAAALGLDRATFARMLLFKERQRIVSGPHMEKLAYELITGRTVPDVPPPEPEIYEDRDPTPAEVEGYLSRRVATAEAEAETLDLEAIIERRVAERLAASSSRADTYAEGQTGMHAHRRGLLPEYGGVAPGGVAFRIQRHPVFGA